jgi:hypothetical protein
LLYRYEAIFNPGTQRYEIMEVVVQEDGTDYHVNGSLMVRKVISMDTQQWLRFTYTIEGADEECYMYESDTEYSHMIKDALHNG